MRLCWSLTVFLGVALGVTLYVFIVCGSVAPASDGRAALLLTPQERDLVLTEMRAFLVATQTILASAAGDNLRPVVPAARAVGAQAQQGVPATLMGKLPIGFKTLGLDTHRRFDQLALNAEEFGDPRQTLAELGELLANCVACHAVFRIDAVAE